MPNVQVSISLPLALNDTQRLHSYAYGGTEFGLKTRFVQESRSSPQISFYPSVEIPAAAGARAVTFLPLWFQKSAGPWTVFGGGGLYLAAASGKRDSTFAGIAVERALSERTTVGVECYREATHSSDDSDVTAANIGVTTQVGRHHAILFSFGRAFHGGDTFSAYASYEFALGPSKSQ